MSKFLTLVKSKKGAALMTAISFMTIAVALCSIITTFILSMASTSSSYTSVNENKIVADQIAEEFMSCCENNSNSLFKNLSGNNYSNYTFDYYISDNDKSAGEPSNDAGYDYYCYAYESSSSSTPLIYIEIKNDGSNYKYTRYEYGNI